MVPRLHEDADPAGSKGVDHQCGHQGCCDLFDDSSLSGQFPKDGLPVTHFCKRNEIFTCKQNHFSSTEANDQMRRIKIIHNPMNLLTLVASLFFLSQVGLAQGSDQAKPVAYRTAPKLVIAKLTNAGVDVYDVRGKITFTLTAANSDDTVVGTIDYSIPDDARQQIATLTGKPLASVQSSFRQTGVIANFQAGTAAPVIHLEISPMDVTVSGAQMRFNRIVVDVNGREGNASIRKYSPEEVEVLLTVWARQINAGRQARGVISRLNRTINGEPE